MNAAHNSTSSWWWRAPRGTTGPRAAACEAHARIDRDPAAAVEGAHLLVDVWASMGQESEQAL